MAASIKPHVENASKEDKLEFFPSLLNYSQLNCIIIQVLKSFSTIYTVEYLSG